MIRPSPNEFERLKNEEFIKRRILRLKEVREHSRANASRLRHLYKEQKTKVINKIAENIQEQINYEDCKKIHDLQSKYDKQRGALGDAHNNASDWVDPVISMREKAENNQNIAKVRHELAVTQQKIYKEERDLLKNARINALNMALSIEKERAAAVASLPPQIDPLYNENVLKNLEEITPRVRVCDGNKFSVIEGYEKFSYNVERINDNSQTFQYGKTNAMDAGEIRQQKLLRINTNMQIESEEQAIKAQLRGNQAIKKQIVQKDYGELLTNLEHISKGEMAKRQRDYHKNELIDPNSANFLGIGHTAAMTGYKERCRERAVETAVLESLKDITNKTQSTQQGTVSNETENKEGVQPTKLSKLYDIIRRQKENVTFENNETLDTSRGEYNVENIDEEREECLSLVMIEMNEDVESSHSNYGDYAKDILQNAAAAAIKSSSILEKSNHVKERNMIEEKIQHIDKRLGMIKESHTDISREDSVRSVVSDDRVYDIHCSIHRSDNVSVAASSETVCSDSLNIIKEFQRQALAKLSGYQPAQYHSNNLYALDRQFSDLSRESCSSTDRIRINHLMGTDDTTLEASSASHSSVNEWVKTQLIQTVDRIPEWVTNGSPEKQFLPDINMSFMSSILNIRSETASNRDETMSSCSTVLTHSSLVRHTGRSSITEITKMGSSTDVLNYPVNNRSCDTSVLEEPVSYVPKQWRTGAEDSNCIDNRDIFGIEQRVDSVKNYTEELTSMPISCEDLIDFQSVENLDTIHNDPSEEERSYQMALNQLINMADIPNYDRMIDIQCSESESEQNIDYFEFPLPLHPDLQDINSNITESNKIVNDDNKIISDYENFLNGLTKKPLSPSFICTDLSSTLTSNVNLDRSFEQTLTRSSSQATVEVKLDHLESESCEILNHDLPDISTNYQTVTPCNSQVSYFTSSTKEQQQGEPLMSQYISPIQPIHTLTPQFPNNVILAPSDIETSSSMEQLSPYSSDTSETCVSNSMMKVIPNRELSVEQQNAKKFKQFLSSTMKPERCNTKPISPDVSSISSMSADACNRLKQRIMMEYFEKNKNIFTSQSSNTTSTNMSMKPLESGDDSTPRHLDSGKPSSRLTLEHSEQNTARLTSDDIFVTPRSDNNWTEYTPRDEWSTSHTNFQALSEYTSATNQEDSVDKIDLDVTLKNNEDEDKDPIFVGSCGDLIDFETNIDVKGSKQLFNEGIAGSQSLSDSLYPCDGINTIAEDNVPSKESSSACFASSFHALDSFYSSSESPCNRLSPNEIHEFEKCYQNSFSDESVVSRSDADTSSISLASFLKNESMCQEVNNIEENTSTISKSKGINNNALSIDNCEEMKAQLSKWKKDRLNRINQHPLESGTNNGPFVTKTGTIRKHDEIEKRSRTLRLYNNLEEVQKIKQKKEAEQRKTDNQRKKKEYAEKLRRLKREK